MDKIIAVEENLTPVKELLTEKGYKVESIGLGSGKGKDIESFDAIVITGMSKDFLGVQDTITKVPVIDAKGLTAEEVYERLAENFKQ